MSSIRDITFNIHEIINYKFWIYLFTKIKIYLVFVIPKENIFGNLSEFLSSVVEVLSFD